MSEKNEFNQIIGYAVENWCPAKNPPRAIMHGKYCTIEPINLARHANKLFDNISLDNLGESWTYLPYGPFTTCDEFQKWLQNTNAEQDTQLYAILNNENIPIGIAGYLRINPEHGVIEVGHLHYSKLLQKTVAATEAMYLMMRHAFDDLGYRRYEWKCNVLNEPSKKAALRLGFTFEGIFRQSHVLKNRNRDTAWFSMIDSEWPAIKKIFQRWLDPRNFNPDNEQIQSLSEDAV